MLIKFKNILKGRNKFFLLFFFTVVAILVLGILSPVLLENKKKHWSDELDGDIAFIESSAKSLLREEQNLLLRKSDLIKNEVLPLLDPYNRKNARTVFKKINSEQFSGYSIEFVDNDEKLLAWTNNVAIPNTDFLPLAFEPGETFFYRSDLATFLSVIDTCSAGNKIYYFSVCLPVEKHFEIQNNYYQKVNLTESLAKNYRTEVEINYSQFAKPSLDGRKFSVEIDNNRNHKIAVISFDKPSLDSRLNSLNDDIYDYQSILAIAGVLFLIFGFWKDFRKINKNILKFFLVFIAAAAFRYLLYKLNFPAKFLDSPLTNSSYFASTFGGGIVKSPLEFFITAILFLVISVNFYIVCWNYFNQNRNKKKRNIALFLLVLILGTVLYLFFLRGLGASLKSVIFDSSLRYFKETGVLPNLPAGLMELNVLILGMCSILVSVSIILIIISFLSFNKSERIKVIYTFIFIYLFLQVSGYLFDYLQSEPQGNGLIRVLFITFTFILCYKIYFEETRNIYNYIYAALFASIITVSLLNFYNSKKEQESLKTTATELTRTNESLLEFLVTQTLVNASKTDETYRALKDQLANYEAAAFIIWSQSLLQKERLNSAVTLLNKRKVILGSFGIDLDEKYRINPLALKYEGSDVKIYNNYKPANLNGSIICGILPVKEDGVVLGYIIVSILFDESNYGRIDYPKVLSPNYNSLNSMVDFEKLMIFDFKNNELENVYGEVVPPDEITRKILHTKFINSEAWEKLNINNDKYITYALKFIRDNNDRILVVALRENDLSWSLYNFLKVFFIHMIFIVAFLAIIFTEQLYKARKIKYTFRIQLLGAFLFLSLFPLLLLAFYNRNLSEEKNNEATLDNLKQKALSVERYLEDYSAKHQVKNLNLLCEKASEDLDINYSLYAEKMIKYSSNEEYYEAGLLPDFINPNVYARFEFLGFKEYLSNENIEMYNFNSFYKKIKLYNADYILKVDDIFNKVSLPITGEEYDVFLFGSYSVVIILIVLFSAFLANRISLPIRKLTKATSSVAEGDLNLEVKSSHKGEVGALVNGFNLMIRQLKKSQVELAEMERENAWKEMARQVAHEIKNPLTPMKLAVQQLVIAYKDKSSKFDSIFDKVSKTIISQIETLSNIASEFTTFARMPKLKMESFNIVQSLEESVNLFLEEKVEIKINKNGSEFFVAADRDQLKRTIINLVRNSIQASADRIEINLGIQDSKVLIEIKDNGKGIPPETLPKVFEQNFTTKDKGMGLGLKLAKKYLEAIGGNIKISESSDRGTTIQIWIPEVKNKV